MLPYLIKTLNHRYPALDIIGPSRSTAVGPLATVSGWTPKVKVEN